MLTTGPTAFPEGAPTAAIARALVNNPSLILGDEPTGQLDQKNTEIVVAQLRDLARQGFTVVLVTHEDDIATPVTESSVSETAA